MCGRYVIDDGLGRVLEAMGYPYEGNRTGEIFPTNQAPILLTQGIAESVWGFPKWRQSGVIINARAETAAEKKMFQPAFRNGRCVVPASGFYEWNGEKKKLLFQPTADAALFMAGLARSYEGQLRYVILTTAANASVADVHNRMPVVLPQAAVEAWLKDETAAADLLRRVPPELTWQFA